MAQLNLKPPEQFNFRNPDEWPRWMRRFEQYRAASGLTDDSEGKQVSTLLYCLGEQAETVLTSTNATATDRTKYDTVIQKFDGFFKVHKNVIFERARFNRRNQREGESTEQYIMALYDLAEHCDYGNLQSEMSRDRLVVGIRDGALSERLQTDAAMCFAKTTAGSVEANADSMDTAFLDNLTSPARQETIWSTRIQLNCKLTPFKLDTGAEVTAISGTTHEHLGKPKLNIPDKILYGPSRQPLQVVGQFKGTFAHKGKLSQQQVYVVKGLKTNPLLH